MTDYTPHRNLPYPEGSDQVVVHTDVRSLALKTDAELQMVEHTVGQLAREVARYEAPPRVPFNLIDMADSVPGSLSGSGNVTDHSTNRVTPFIRVHPGVSYVSSADQYHRVVFFDASQNNITTTNTDLLPSGQTYAWIAPANAAYVRVGMVGGAAANAIFNEGTELWDPDSPHGTSPSGYWDGRETPRLRAREVRMENLEFTENGRIPQPVVDGAVPPRLTNLIDPAQVVSGSLSGLGNIIPHSSNVTTDLIPVDPGEPYVSTNLGSTHRVVWFTEAGTVVAGQDTGLQPMAVASHWVAPQEATHVRIGINIAPGYTPADAIFNRGTELWDPDSPPSTGWWDDRELPPSRDGGTAIDEAELTLLVERLLPQYEPSFPTLTFDTIYTGWQEPKWLSTDGQVLYGTQGRVLLQSTDEWETLDQIHVFDEGYNLQAIRELDNGELIVSTNRDETVGRKAKLWLSTGYQRSNPTAATWTEVLEAGAPQANFNNSWGLHVYQNIVVAGEYGLRGEDGARRVYLSEDYGQTFALVFDQKNVTATNPDNQPEWTQSGHVHTAAWDPYWSRLWVVVGDSPSTATYYSDDKGQTWHYVEGSGGPSPAVQYTGIMPLPDMVIFGSDRAPNGVHAYRRTTKADMPVITPLLLVDDADVITRVFQLPYRRDWQPTTPTYFAASGAAGVGSSVIVGTADGKKAHLLWEGVHPQDGGAYSGRVSYAFGPTAQGNLIVPMHADPTITGVRVMKTPAPTWARA